MSAAVRRNRALWAAMAVGVAVVLVLAGRSEGPGATSDERLFDLAGQLKCLQCVGESVAASQAPLAEQFRQEIRDQMEAGASDDEILAFFTERYGRQVLLTPSSAGAGWVVWLLPVAVAGAATVALVWALPRKRTAPCATEPGSAPGGSAVPGATDGDGPVGAGPGGWGRRVLVVAPVVVFFAVLGVLLVRGTGERGDGGGTGSGRTGDDLAACRTTAMRDPAGAVDCYDRVLGERPDDVEALSYRGWAQLRAGDAEAAAVDLDRAVELDPTYPDARLFRSIAASRAEDFATAATELQAFYAGDPSSFATSVVASEGLERTIFFGLMDLSARACWQQAAQSGDGAGGPLDQGFLDGLAACLDGVLAADPTNRDARFSRAVAAVGPDGRDLATASSLLEGLLSEDPDDADALSLRVVVEVAGDDLEAAEADLDRLATLGRAPVAFLVGDVDALRAALEGARAAGVPNPDGG